MIIKSVHKGTENTTKVGLGVPVLNRKRTFRNSKVRVISAIFKKATHGPINWGVVYAESSHKSSSPLHKLVKK